MKLTDFDAVTFDCYGTLIDWETGILATLRPWATRNGMKATDDELLHAYSTFESARETAHPRMRYPDVLAAVFRDIGRRFGATVSDEEAEAFGGSVRDWPPFADSADGLAYLRGHYRLGILSNIDRASFAHSQAKLGVEFDLVVTAQDVGSYKPAPAHFEAAFAQLATMGVPRQRILHAAESLHHDHVPARQFGLASIWIHRRAGRGGGFGATKPPEIDVKPTWEVTSMAEFVALHRTHLREE